MRILIVGSDTSLGEVLLDFFLLQGRHSIKNLLQDECRWKSERQTKKALSRASCDLVVDAGLWRPPRLVKHFSTLILAGPYGWPRPVTEEGWDIFICPVPVCFPVP